MSRRGALLPEAGSSLFAGTPGAEAGVSRRGALLAEVAAGRAPDDEAVARVVAADAVQLGARGVARAGAALRSAVLGAGPLEALLAEPGVTDVLVNGPQSVWVDRGAGVEPVDLDLGSAEEVRRLAVRLAGIAGRRLDDAAPWVDGQLPGGVRLHAVLPPLAEGCAYLSLRVPRRATCTLTDWVAWGSCSTRMAAVLEAVIAARVAFVVSGGTGTGKTTLLGAMLGLVPRSERLLLVEDVAELRVDHPHVVRLQSRAANVEGRGAVGLETLVRQSLRMRPDRLVVGEVRGAEVRELLTALNTGHEGGAGTLHANAAADVPARFEALGALAGMSPAALASQLAAAIRVVVHVRRDAGRRVVEEISVLRRVGAGVEVVPALRRRADEDVPGPGLADLLAAVGPC